MTFRQLHTMGLIQINECPSWLSTVGIDALLICMVTGREACNSVDGVLLIS